MDQFKLTDEQLVRIAPHRPNDKLGKKLVDDRILISGIVLVAKSSSQNSRAPGTLPLAATAQRAFCERP